MAEEAPAVNPQEVPQETPATESAPVENNTPEVAESEQEKADKAVAASLSEPETEDEEKQESEAPVEETKAEEQPLSKAEERKQQLNNEIRDLVAKRNGIRQEVERQNADAYQPASEQELQDQGLSPEMAAIEAMKQERELERYTSQVAEAQLTIQTEAENALKDFPMFDEKSSEYNKDIAARADKILGANLVLDPNTNQVIGSNVSLYELYQSFAEAARVSAVEGQVKAQKASEQMLSRSDSTSNASPAKETEKDNFLKGLLGDK